MDLSKIIQNLSIKLVRKRNRNKDFTLISRNCIGGIVYHQYGLKFLSPTINLFFSLDEFNFFCLNLKEYINADLKQIHEKDKSYPVGLLKPKEKELAPIKVYFMHYKSFEEAHAKWDERKCRINWKNIYVVNDCTTEGSLKIVNSKIIDDFNRITYKKVIYVKHKIGFENEFVINNNKSLLDKKNNSWKYNFNKFNFNKFLR